MLVWSICYNMVIQVAVSTLARYRWIDWVDPPMCARSVQIIPGLLRARNRHEASIQELTNQVSKCDNRLTGTFGGVLNFERESLLIRLSNLEYLIGILSNSGKLSPDP
ncbi:hypothetical protein Tco_0742155 [Tanacetum coccineum]